MTIKIQTRIGSDFVTNANGSYAITDQDKFIDLLTKEADLTRNLSIEEKQRLAKEAKIGNKQSIETLVLSHLAQIKILAQCLKWKTRIELCELHSESYIRLMDPKTWSNYDENKYDDPTKFIKGCIRNAMIDYIRKLFESSTKVITLEYIEKLPDPYTEGPNKLDKDILSNFRWLIDTIGPQAVFGNKKAVQVFELLTAMDYGSNPTEEKLSQKEIATRLGISVQTVNRIKQRIENRIKILFRKYC